MAVISGETGCGKTTQVKRIRHAMSMCKSMSPMAARYVFLLHCVQVPQFILDDAIMSGCGSRCHLVCTQPRRISAISGAHI